MELTQEAILKILLEGRGRVKNSELLSRFKDPLNCTDPAQKKQNRDLFKTFVNNIAVVKEFQDTRYIVLKKVYHHLLEASSDENKQHDSNEEDHKDESSPAERDKEQHKHSQDVEGKKSDLGTVGRSSSVSSNSSVGLSSIEIALERSRNVDFKPKRSLHFTVPLKSDPDDSDKYGAMCPAKNETSTNKPYALPLRMPLVVISHHNKKSPTDLETDRSEQQTNFSPKCKRRPSADSVVSSSGSPQLRRHYKTLKQTDELKYAHHCPLDPVEHEWLVKSATGQWNQAYGLLLKDAQLAEKKDFMSGFTALHWAVKCGNSDMVCRIIDQSRKSDCWVDVNAKSHGGYTPLHIAAIHDQVYLINLLVRKYGANSNVRDNCGKKPYHYLHKGVPLELRELLGDPKAIHQEMPQDREDYDPHKQHQFKNRLFPPHTVGVKMKQKFPFLSMGDVRDERDEPVSHKQRLLSDVFS